MANVLVEENTLKDIADAIRSKTGKTDLLLPSQMAAEINELKIAQGDTVVSDFIASDPLLRYFTYHIDFESKTITLYKIFYDKLYADNGSYNVTIPDTLGGYNVIISNV